MLTVVQLSNARMVVVPQPDAIFLATLHDKPGQVPLLQQRAQPAAQQTEEYLERQQFLNVHDWNFRLANNASVAQGAFQGKTPREAYLVKCDRETTTQNDINAGIQARKMKKVEDLW